ncbi:MAG: S1C family serine protease [Thermoguttaceae bacterium]
MTENPPPDGRMAKWILLLTLFLVAAARIAAGQEVDNPPAETLYEKAKAASVEILVDDHMGGSGWFADPQGLLFTASHVISRPGRRIEVLSPEVGRIDAQVVAVDLGHDLALLRVESREGGYPALKLAECVPPPGERVFLFGAPIFRSAVLLPGTVARDNTVFGYYTERYVEITHIAATVQGGTSGGPWLSEQGEAIGLQSGTISLKSVPVGIANVIPIEPIRALLKSQRTTATPTMGAAIEETWQQQRDFLDRFAPRTEGLVVRILKSDGPAVRAGLKQWDVITAADDQPVRLSGQLLRIIRAKQPGDSVKLSVLGPDGTGRREVTVRLGKLEAGWPQPEDASDAEK